MPVRFKLKIGDNGEAELELHAFRITTKSRFVEEHWQNEGPSFSEYRLVGTSDDGFRFETDSLIFLSMGERWSGRSNWHRSKPRGECSKIVLLRDDLEFANRTFLELHLKGFECMPALQAANALGRITVAGASKLEEHDRLSGYVRIVAGAAPEDVAGWRRDAEALIEHIRSILSLGSGTVLRAPIMMFAHDGRLEIEILSQSRQHPPEMRVVHKLDQQALLDAALGSWPSTPILTSKLPFAIEWFAMTSIYNEVRLVAAMTSLENLVDSNLTKDEALVQPRSAFDKMKRALRTVVEEHMAGSGLVDAEQVADEIADKFIDLNRRPFRRKLAILAARWGVPLDDISESQMMGAINARNSVVHRGQYLPECPDADLWGHMIVARELVVRFLLTAIGFRGNYLSYLGVCHRAKFPPDPTQCEAD